MKLALIDLGSNSARMYILEYSDSNGFRYISRRRVMTRLSEGMKGKGVLQEESMRRTMAVLSEFAAEAAAEKASVLAVATAAVRNAENSQYFCDMIENSCGIKLNIISGETEAYFDFKGAMAGLPEIRDCVIIDTGGGSTELIYVKDERMLKKTSIPIGAVNLYELYGKSYTKAKNAVEKEIKRTGFLDGICGIPLVGSGGSMCAVAAMDKNLNHENKDLSIHGQELSREKFGFLLDELMTKTPEQRIELGIEKGRADTICFGLLPAATIMELALTPKLILCRYGLREGILAEMLNGCTEKIMENPREFIEKFSKK